VVEAHDTMVISLGSELRRAGQLFDEGRAPRVQVLRAEAALSRASADREAAAARSELAVHRLVRVSGLPAERVAAARLVPVEPAPGPVPDRAEVLAIARRANPSVARATARASAAAAGVTAARSAWLPRLSIGGTYSTYGASNLAFAPEWNLGVQVAYPLFTGGSRLRAAERAAAELDAAMAELAVVERQVEDGADAMLVAHRTALARATALEAAVAQSAEVARIEALALEAGAGLQTDYLRAAAELLVARAELAEARRAVAEAHIGLARAMGRLDPERVADLLIEGAP
jgi:outer membrane protein TolC